MIKSYLKIAARTLYKNKGYSFTNILGLSIGLSVCLLAFIFVHYERSFDWFHQNGIYRLGEVQRKDGFSAEKQVAQTMFPMGPTLKAEFPEIKDIVQIISWEDVPLQSMDKNAVNAKMLGTGQSFLNVFNFKLLAGDGQTALTNPHSIVLTRQLADKLFGSVNPIGKMVRHYGRDTVDYIVTGILANIPEQSHLHFDALYSMNTEQRPDWMRDWKGDWVFTYILLKKNANVTRLENKLPQYLKKYLPSEKSREYRLFLQPLKDIHLGSATVSNDFLNWQKFDERYIQLIILIVLVVMAISIINYVNLTTARSLTRSKEIGVRKTNGASRFQVVVQFIVEALFFTLLALLVALIFVQLSLPALSRLSDRSLDVSLLQDIRSLFMALGIAMITGVVAGLFPGLTLSAIPVYSVLKGQWWTNSKSTLRNTLVVIQVTVAITLSIAAIVAFRQLKYIQNYDVGFDSHRVMVLHVSPTARERVETLLMQLRQLPAVADATGSLRRLGNNIDRNEIIFNKDVVHKITCATMFVDYNYLPFYQIKLVAGRNLSSSFAADRLGNSYLINETLARQLIARSANPHAPLETLIGQDFYYTFQDPVGKIIGITRDFNFNSLHQKIEPMSLTYQYDYYFSELSVKLRNANIQGELTPIRNIWNAALPEQPFNYHFLTQHLQDLYKPDRQTGLFIGFLTAVGLLVSAIGLIALVSYHIKIRTKEIGIRKCLGATIINIVILLSLEFMFLVAMSILIAIPVAWIAVNKWLDSFAYHLTVTWVTFLTIGVATLLIGLITVSFQSIRAALLNPIKSLSTE